MQTPTVSIRISFVAIETRFDARLIPIFYIINIRKRFVVCDTLYVIAHCFILAPANSSERWLQSKDIPKC